MDVQPPELGWAFEQTEEQTIPTLDALFAQVLNALMIDEISASTAIQYFEKASILAMQQYR